MTGVRQNAVAHGTMSWETMTGWWFQPTLKNMTLSVGMMKFPTEWKNKIHAPSHQPDDDLVDLGIPSFRTKPYSVLKCEVLVGCTASTIVYYCM